MIDDIKNTILQHIGNTPLILLKNITRGEEFEIFAKAEFLNPSGSLKDRIAIRMIGGAEKSGCLKKGGTIIEASTGNTAIALSFVGTLKGYKVIIFIPEKTASKERIEILKKYGADVRTVSLVPKGENKLYDASVHGGFYEIPGRMMCRDMEKQPDIWWARQFSNPDNVAAHRDGTGKEIDEQMSDKIDAVVASIGTGGTFLGLAQALEKHSPLLIAVEPTGHPMVSAKLKNYPIIEGITDGIVYDIVQKDLLDKVLVINDEEAIAMTRRLIREEGLFCGISSGANVVAAMRIGREISNCKRIITVLPDSYYRYLTSEHYTT
jgi:cysteine synthase A